jgi:[NiFe] hydrogenase diaphorase moiety large subunit
MLVSERYGLSGEIAELAERYGRQRSGLLPILQAIQEKYFHISDFAMQEVAAALDIHPVEVYSVVTFFAFLKAERRGRFVIRLCRTISCDMQGKDRVARQLENDLGIRFGQTTPDGRFSLEWANCIGMCDQGPALLVNDQVFAHVTVDKVREILEACRRSFGANVAQEGGKTHA